MKTRDDIRNLTILLAVVVAAAACLKPASYRAGQRVAYRHLDGQWSEGVVTGGNSVGGTYVRFDDYAERPQTVGSADLTPVEESR